jgi:riboflavin kinase/FMN adenylyltransferase
VFTFIRGLLNLPAHFPRCVASIGNFDGVHKGHQVLIQSLLEKSAALHLPSVLITFEPQPNEFFAEKKAPARLMRLREKWLALQDYALDYVLCLRFNKKLAALSPQAFIEKILVEKLHVTHLIVGDDFHFGAQRAGDFAFLQQEGRRWNLTAERMSTYAIGGQRVSSSRVRSLLQQGDLPMASTLLGDNYTMSGRVTHGNKRGRMIGFPTANIFLHRKTVPLSGVYAVKVQLATKEMFYGVANVGMRPTIGGTYSLLEAHIFDFHRDIYGQYIQVEFVKKLRDEVRYDSFELLRQQILKDAAHAKAYFLEEASHFSPPPGATSHDVA